MSVSSNPVQATVSVRQPLILFGLVMILLGLALRILGARGDLWLDEVHSLNLVSGLHTPDEVFWHINHDNNHFLTSLYLFFAGPDHSSLVLRLESIVLGTLSIPAAGLAAMGGRGRDVMAASLAMMFAALTYPAVHYGSEARGYAGMVLFSFLAIHRIEAGMDTKKDQALFGVIVLFGILSHMLMIIVTAGLFLWRWALLWRPGLDAFDAMGSVIRKFWAAILAGALVAACIMVGSLHHGFIRGGIMVSTLPQFITGIETFLDFTIGLPVRPGLYPGLLVVLALLAIQTCLTSAAGRPRTLLYAIFLSLYPTWMVVSGTRDFHQPRNCMPMFAPLLLLMAECGSLGMRRGRAGQLITIGAIALVLAGSGYDLARFFRDGRGDYTGVVAAMTRNGPATYGGDVPAGQAMVTDYYAHRLGVTATFIPTKDWCVMTPDWLIHNDRANPFPPQIHLGPSGCDFGFARFEIFPAWGMSGVTWTLYRRVAPTQNERK